MRSIAVQMSASTLIGKFTFAKLDPALNYIATVSISGAFKRCFTHPERNAHAKLPDIK